MPADPDEERCDDGVQVIANAAERDVPAQRRELMEVSPGAARVRLPSSSSRSNGLGTTHGAVIFALADVAFAVACNSHGQTAIGIQANIAYLTAAGDGPIEARATELSRGRKLATYEVRVVDESEKLVAAFQGTAYLR